MGGSILVFSARHFGFCVSEAKLCPLSGNSEMQTSIAGSRKRSDKRRKTAILSEAPSAVAGSQAKNSERAVDFGELLNLSLTSRRRRPKTISATRAKYSGCQANDSSAQNKLALRQSPLIPPSILPMIARIAGSGLRSSVSRQSRNAFGDVSAITHKCLRMESHRSSSAPSSSERTIPSAR